MKKQLKATYTYLAAALLIMAGATSCKKEVSANGAAGSGTVLATTATSSTIAVSTNGAGSSTGSTTTDSVYVIHTCERGQHRDSVAASALPVAVQTYLSSNYNGYTFNKAFSVKDTTGTITGYVVIINYNGKPVGLLFKADGTLVKVLEQREKGDMQNEGWHRGGRFEKRDGQHRDTLALSALPSAVISYMNTNYSTDTLLKAFTTADSGYLVISKNGGVYATLFNSTGAFVKRTSLPAPGTIVSVADANLPSAALTYLATTYPNYVLDKAFSVSVAGTLKGYVAVIDANNTRYCVAFDASGNFIAVKTIW